jgi:hypothetical protein
MDLGIPQYYENNLTLLTGHARTDGSRWNLAFRRLLHRTSRQVEIVGLRPKPGRAMLVRARPQADFAQRPIFLNRIAQRRMRRLKAGRAMMKSALLIGSAVLASNFAANGQSNVVASPAAGGPVHPGTVILDQMGLFAGVPTPIRVPVHPGTAILDTAGIFAGTPVPVPVIDGTARGAGNAVTLK